VTVINYGANSTKHARFGLTVPPGLEVLGVTTTEGSCTHGASEVRCYLGRLTPAVDVSVRVRLGALRSGTARVRTRVFDTWTTDDFLADNHPRLITHVG
jgi:hypothetical protein